MKRLESFTEVICRRQDFRTVPFIYLIRIYHSIHVDQVYREQYIRNTVKISLSRGRHVHLKTYKQQQQQQNSVDEIADASRDFPWDF